MLSPRFGGEPGKMGSNGFCALPSCSLPSLRREAPNLRRVQERAPDANSCPASLPIPACSSHCTPRLFCMHPFCAAPPKKPNKRKNRDALHSQVLFRRRRPLFCLSTSFPETSGFLPATISPYWSEEVFLANVRVCLGVIEATGDELPPGGAVSGRSSFSPLEGRGPGRTASLLWR